MRRVWRVLALLAVLVLLTVGGFAALLTRVDGDAFAAATARALSAALDREVTVDGGARIGFWPLPGLHSGRIAAGDGTLEAPSAVLVPDPLALLGGEARPWAVVLIRPRMTLRLGGDAPVLPAPAARHGALRHIGALAGSIRLEGWGATLDVRRASLLVSSASGLSLRLGGDWNGRAFAARFAAGPALAPAAADDAEISLALRAGDDRMSYDGRLGRDGSGRLTADGRLAVSSPDAGSLATALGLSPPPLVGRTRDIELEAETRLLPDELRLRLSAAAAVAGQTVSLRVAMHGGSDWRRDGAASVEAVSRGGGLYSAYFSGRQTGPEGLGGRVTLSVSDLPAIQDWLGVPRAARLFDAARASFSAELAADRTAIRLTDAEAAIGALAVAGALGVEFGAVHSVTGNLDLSELDLTDLHATGYARLRAALAALGDAGVDMAVTLRTARARLGRLVLGDVRAGLTHRDGEAVVAIDRVDVMDGVASGRLGVATTGPARLTGEAALAEVDAASASEMLGLGLLTGAMAGTLRFEVPDLAAPDVGGLGVEGAISISTGTIALPLTGASPTAFRQFDADIRLSDGALALEALTMETPDGRHAGRLGIGLADRRLDGGTTGPDGRRLVLRGTIDAPEVRPADPVGTVEEPAAPAAAERGAEPPPAVPAEVAVTPAGGSVDAATGPDDGSGPPADDSPAAPADATAASAPQDAPAPDDDTSRPDAVDAPADPRVPIPVPAPR